MGQEYTGEAKLVDDKQRLERIKNIMNNHHENLDRDLISLINEAVDCFNGMSREFIIRVSCEYKNRESLLWASGESLVRMENKLLINDKRYKTIALLKSKLGNKFDDNPLITLDSRHDDEYCITIQAEFSTSSIGFAISPSSGAVFIMGIDNAGEWFPSDIDNLINVMQSSKELLEDTDKL